MAAHQEIEYLRAVGVGAASGIALTGNELANHLLGDSGRNVLNGAGGNDYLDGDAGADTMSGGTGNDAYGVDDAGDQVIEAAGGGYDHVYSSVSWSMAAGQEIEYLGARREVTSGITLTGNGFANRLVGGIGNDVLEGGGGTDRLVGGGGNDIFRFDTTPAPGNVDRISDFSAGDSIELDHTIYAGLALGQLSASAFALDSATGAGPQVVYNHNTGALFFDSNGAAAGGAVRFASLAGAPALDASDFRVI